MSDLSAAAAHLEDAEAAIMSHVATISATPEDVPDDQIPDALPMLLAVLRSVSRAAGIIEGSNGSPRVSPPRYYEMKDGD